MAEEKALIKSVSEEPSPIHNQLTRLKKDELIERIVEMQARIDAGPEDQTEALIRLAVDKDLDVGKLERLIELRDREEAKRSKVEFDRNFAIMQSEIPPVPRSKNVDDKYDYAPLETIVEMIGPIVNRHGFSYRWSEEDLPVQYAEDAKGERRQLLKMRRYWFIVRGFGHEERNYVDLPEQVDNPIANSAQKRGSSMTYGRRYSLVAGLGIVFEGQDDDAQAAWTTDEVLRYGAAIERLNKCDSMKALRETFRVEYDALAGDDEGQRRIMIAKDRLKDILNAAG